MTLLLTVTWTSLRELGRRRIALLFVVVLPLVFYMMRIDVPWQAIRFLAIGVGWAIATLSLFSHVSARHLDRRLSTIGASPTVLFLGRQLALIAVGLVVAGMYFLLVANTQDLPRIFAVALLLVTTVLVAAPLGALFSHILPRELEGSLALLTVMALQLLVDPAGAATRLLPLWSTRELSAYALDSVGVNHLSRGLTHFAITWAATALIAWAAAHLRLKPARLRTPAEHWDHGPEFAGK
jgi:hypothetical protein